MASLETPANSAKTLQERMEDLLDEATSAVPSSPDEFKRLLKQVMRVTFQQVCVATRSELQKNPELLEVGQH